MATDPLRTRMEEAANRADGAAASFYGVLTADENTDVPVEHGATVPSMSKRIKVRLDDLTQQANNTLTQAQLAADTATGAAGVASNAAAQATTASDTAVQAASSAGLSAQSAGQASQSASQSATSASESADAAAQSAAEVNDRLAIKEGLIDPPAAWDDVPSVGEANGQGPLNAQAVALAAKLNMLSVDTIEDLRNLPPPNLAPGRSVVVEVLGYFAAGDGGGGSFYWQGNSNEADNGGLVIVPASDPATGRWKRRNDGRTSVRAFGIIGAGGDVTAPVQRAIDAGFVDLYFPDGFYGIDGYKGASTSFDSTRKGGIFVNKRVRITGESKTGTVLLNIADNWRSVISIRGGSGVSISNITVDGNFPFKTPVPLADDTVRGEGIIGWGGGTLSDLQIDNVHIRNTGHYGLGLQNIKVDRAIITRLTGDEIGGDLIDIKDYEDLSKIGIIIDNCECGKFGTNATALNGAESPAAFDLRGDVMASNLRVTNLNVWIEEWAGAQFTTGVRLNSGTGSGRLGGRKARVIGASVKSSKLDIEGSPTSKRIYGFQVADVACALVGGVAENCYIGFIVAPIGSQSSPSGDALVGCTAINCRGAAGDGTALRLAAGVSAVKAQVIAIDCDLALSSSASRVDVEVTAINCTTVHNVTPNVMREGNYRFLSAGEVASNFSQLMALWGNYGAALRIHSTYNGNAWPAPYRSDGIEFWFEDESNVGKGKRIDVYPKHTGPSGGETFLNVDVKSMDGMPTSTFFHPKGIGIPALATAYADDAAAAAAGIPVNGVYKRTDGVLVSRVS